jgi:hypothetical protein
MIHLRPKLLQNKGAGHMKHHLQYHFNYKTAVFALMLALVSITGNLVAQTVTIGSSGNYSNYAPINMNAKYSATEVRYTGTEINTTGSITSIAFNKQAGIATTVPTGIKIYMKTATSSGLTSTSSTTGYTEVYSGSFPNSGTGWQTITLTTAFPYTSTSNNLHILVVNNTYGTATASNYPYYYYTNTTFNTDCSRYYGSSAWVSGTTSMTQSFQRPDIKIGFAPPVACSGAPTGGTTASTLTTVCPATSFTLSLTGATTGSGLAYQWQSSANGTSGWADISSATAATYATTQTASTYYRCNITCTNSSQTSTSTALQVSMETNPLLCYCKPTYSTGCSGDYISKVVFGTISNTTTCSGSSPSYTTQYASPNPTLTIGVAYPLTVTTGGAKEGIHVWIDYNRNNVFEASESVYTSYANANPATYSTSITIPSGATPGTTGMRIMAKYNSAPGTGDACGSTSYGEAEDYLVTIASASNCSTATFPASVNATASKSSICSSESVDFNLSAGMPAVLGITYQWKSSADNVTYANAGSAASSPAATLTAGETARWFKCEVLCNGSVVLTSAPVQISLNIEVTSTTPASRCGAGSVTLQATAVAGNTLRWYVANSGGAALGTGTSFNTPNISTPTTYYVSAGTGTSGRTGVTSPSISSGMGSTNIGGYQIFDVTQALTIDSVTVYPTSIYAGAPYTLIIELQSSTGTVLQTKSFTVSSAQANSTNSSVGTPMQLYLGFSIPVGTGYRLAQNNTLASTATILRNLSGVPSTYYNVNNNGLTFTGNSIGSNSYWYHFYDWVTHTGCGETARKPVTATINTAPAVTASSTATFAGALVQLFALPNSMSTYSWSGPNTYTSNAQNPTLPNAATTASGTYTVTVTSSNGCTGTSSTAVTVAPAIFVWTGTISTNWHLPGNWNLNAVPNPNSTYITIPFNPTGGRFPEISAPAEISDITVEDNASITITNDLKIYGNWQGGIAAPAIINGDGRLVLAGSAQQTINGYTQFNTLNVDNTNGATLNTGATAEVFTALELEQGTFSTTNGNMRFRSTSPTACAIINNFSPGFSGTLSGNISADRYYAAPTSAISFGQHYMGSPVNGAPASQFGASGKPGYVISMPGCYADKVAANSPSGTFYEYDESHGTNCGVECWKAITTGAAQNGKGYSVAKTGTGVLTLSGTANLNSVYTVGGLTNSNWSNTSSYHFTAPFTTLTVRSGWHLISNPYLANLNITDHAANNSFDNQVQVWHTTGAYAGTYQPLMTGVDALIAPFQAFMVHKTAAGDTAQYELHAADRSVSPAAFYKQANHHLLKITVENIADGQLDATVVAFNADATEQFDPIYDANKMMSSNTRHNLFTNLGGVEYSINTVKDIMHTTAVPVSMRPGTNGTFRFTADGIASFDATSYIYLEDKVTGQWTDLRQNPDYTFSMNINESAERFVLHFTPPAAIEAIDATCAQAGSLNITQAGAASWSYTLTDAANAVAGTGKVNEAQPANLHLTNGKYLLVLTDTNGYTVKENIEIAGAEPVQASFAVSSINVQEQQPVYITSSTAGAVSYLWDFGNGTTATAATPDFAYTSVGVYTVSLKVTNGSGCSSEATQLITVTAAPTGIHEAGPDEVKIWSNGNTVTVYMPEVIAKGAVVEFYNSLGQLLHKAAGIESAVYSQAFENISAGYIVARISSNQSTTIKKVFITNKQ